ncbi:transposase [Streptomyces sp. CRPSP2-6A1]|nr:transposase [Streptomyces sp. CRPSP2-6A1]MBJ7000150.1 transposase [Streptomyces sp. CRPSP2-6A1]
MTDAEWETVRPLLPVPAWLRGRGGQPEAYCHRTMLDAIRYLVDNGIPADTGDRTAAHVLLKQVTDAHHRLELVWADGGYTGSLVEHCLAAFALVLAIVKRSDDIRGFVVLPKRWIVERLFAHLMRSRRLVRDFERRTISAEAMIYWSMIGLMTRRLARSPRGRA